ncbi:Uncharacterised protein [Bordetella pertussis]|nr:Uncharacterised protein [Bordetella pertussis]
MALGRVLQTNTSAAPARRLNASRPPSRLRSSMMLRLLRLVCRNMAPMPRCRAGPRSRMLSPSGGSILITSAPMSPRIWVATGPDSAAVMSSTRTPLNGPSIPLPLSGCLSRFRPG